MPQISTNGPRLGAASARAGNVIGGGDWGLDRLVPDCIRALSGHQPIGIRSPHAVRPWQHVLEPLGGYLLLGAALWQDPQKYSGPWNFGPDDGSHLTVAAMADRLIKYWGDGSWEDSGTDLKSVPQGDALRPAGPSRGEASQIELRQIPRRPQLAQHPHD